MSKLGFLVLAVMAVFLCSPSAVIAAAAVDVGDTLPALDLKDQDGQAQNFDTVKGEQGAVLYFVRSADWCPYCQAQLLEIMEYGAEIEDAGYSIVAVSYDGPEKLKAFADKYHFPYVMLSDEGSAVIKALGILNEEMKPDSAYYGIPHPTVYVVGSDGIVHARLAEEGYETRPAAAQILEALQ